MKQQSLIAVFFLIVLPTLARADLCAGPTVAAVLAEVQATGPCTIEDKTFNFTSYQNYGSDAANAAEYDAGSVGFVPLTGVDPGFELTGAFSSTSNTLAYGLSYLYYTVSVTDGSSRLTGITANLNNSLLAVTEPSMPDSISEAIDVATTNLYSIGQQALVEPYENQSSGQATPSTVSNTFSPSLFSPIPSASGYSEIGSQADNYDYDTGTYGGGTASASFTSADFTFIETPATVPEPSAFILLATVGALLFMPIRRRWYQQQK